MWHWSVFVGRLDGNICVWRNSISMIWYAGVWLWKNLAISKFFASFNSYFYHQNKPDPITFAKVYGVYCCPQLEFGLCFSNMFDCVDSLSVVNNNALRRIGRLPYRSNVIVTNCALNCLPVKVSADIECISFLGRLFKSCNPVVSKLLMRDQCRFVRFVKNIICANYNVPFVQCVGHSNHCVRERILESMRSDRRYVDAIRVITIYWAINQLTAIPGL